MLIVPQEKLGTDIVDRRDFSRDVGRRQLSAMLWTYSVVKYAVLTSEGSGGA